MRKILYIFTILCLGIACQDIPEGYLISEYAGYSPDSMVVRKELDTEVVKVPNPEYQEKMQEYEEWGKDFFTLEEWLEMLAGYDIYETIDMPGEDYERVRLNKPWVSATIQGVSGTNPIEMSISRVITDVGDVDKMMQYLTVRNNGMFTLPLDHNVPKGNYKISLVLKGPGHEVSIENVFTIIIK